MLIACEVGCQPHADNPLRAAIRLTNSVFERTVSMRGCLIKGALYANGLTVGHSLMVRAGMRNGSLEGRIQGVAYLDSLKIGKELDLGGIHIDRHVTMHGLQSSGDVRLTFYPYREDLFRKAPNGHTRWIGGHTRKTVISGGLYMDAARIGGRLDGRGLTVGSDDTVSSAIWTLRDAQIALELTARPHFVAESLELYFSQSRARVEISRHLPPRQTEIFGTLDMTGANIGGRIMLQGIHIHGDLLAADVEADFLDLSRCSRLTYHGETVRTEIHHVSIDRIRLHGDLLLRGLTLKEGLQGRSAKIGASVDLRPFVIGQQNLRTEFGTGSLRQDGSTFSLWMPEATIGGYCSLSGATMPSGVNLSSATIGASFYANLPAERAVIGSGKYLDGRPFGLRAKGLQVSGLIDLSALDCTGDLAFDRCQVGHFILGTNQQSAGFCSIELRSARIYQDLSMVGVRAQGFANLDSIRIGGNFEGDGLKIESNAMSRRVPSLNLTGARIDGNASLQNISLRSGLCADTAEITGEVFIRTTKKTLLGSYLSRQGIEVSVSMQAIRIGIRLNARGLKCAHGLDLSHAKVEGDISLSRSRIGSSATGLTWPLKVCVWLRGARIGGQVEAISARFIGSFGAPQAEVGGALILRECRIGENKPDTERDALLRLAAEQTSLGAVTLELKESTFGGPVILKDTRIWGSVHLQATKAPSTHWTNVKVAGNLLGYRAEIGGDAVMNDTEVGMAIDLSKAELQGSFRAKSLKVALRDFAADLRKAIHQSCNDREKPELRGALQFQGAHLGSDLTLEECTLGAGINARQMVIGGSFRISGVEGAQTSVGRSHYRHSIFSLRITGASIKGNLELDHLCLTSGIAAASCQIDGDVSLSEMSVGHGSWLAPASSRLYSISFHNAAVGLELTIDNVTATRSVWLGGVRAGSTVSINLSRYPQIATTEVLQQVRASLEGNREVAKAFTALLRPEEIRYVHETMFQTRTKRASIQREERNKFEDFLKRIPLAPADVRALSAPNRFEAEHFRRTQDDVAFKDFLQSTDLSLASWEALIRDRPLPALCLDGAKVARTLRIHSENLEGEEVSLQDMEIDTLEIASYLPLDIETSPVRPINLSGTKFRAIRVGTAAGSNVLLRVRSNERTNAGRLLLKEWQTLLWSLLALALAVIASSLALSLLNNLPWPQALRAHWIGQSKPILYLLVAVMAWTYTRKLANRIFKAPYRIGLLVTIGVLTFATFLTIGPLAAAIHLLACHLVVNPVVIGALLFAAVSANLRRALIDATPTDPRKFVSLYGLIKGWQRDYWAGRYHLLAGVARRTENSSTFDPRFPFDNPNRGEWRDWADFAERCHYSNGLYQRLVDICSEKGNHAGADRLFLRMKRREYEQPHTLPVKLVQGLIYWTTGYGARPHVALATLILVLCLTFDAAMHSGSMIRPWALARSEKIATEVATARLSVKSAGTTLKGPSSLQLVAMNDPCEIEGSCFGFDFGPSAAAAVGQLCVPFAPANWLGDVKPSPQVVQWKESKTLVGKVVPKLLPSLGTVTYQQLFGGAKLATTLLIPLLIACYSGVFRKRK